jgi:hypothetical protein
MKQLFFWLAMTKNLLSQFFITLLPKSVVLLKAVNLLKPFNQRHNLAERVFGNIAQGILDSRKFLLPQKFLFFSFIYKKYRVFSECILTNKKEINHGSLHQLLNK